MPRLRITLEDHRRLGAAPHLLEEVEVLHVAGADLDHVHPVLEEGVQHAHVHELGDDGQALGVRRLAEHLQPLHAPPLEGVGAGAGLEGAAAHETATRGLDPARGLAHLLRGLHRAGPGDDLDLFPAQGNAFDVDDGVLGMGIAGDDLVGLLDAQHLLHPGEGADGVLIHAGDVADGADHRAAHPAGDVGVHPHRLEALHHAFDLVAGRPAAHHYDHRSTLRARGP